MTDFEFQNQMNRIRDTYGKGHYSEERIKIIWKLSRDMVEDDFAKICTHFIASLKSAPLPQDFAQAIYADRKAKNAQATAERESHRVLESVSKLDCDFCYDTGFIFTKEATIRSQILMRCTCDTGLKAQARWIPQWSPEVGGMFMRQEFPWKLFVPERSEEIPISVQNGKFKFSPQVDNLIQRWKAKIHFSEDFWKHQIESHKGIAT